jgi:FKBP-type peptidyl-prolyl cis-trans isomerase
MLMRICKRCLLVFMAVLFFNAGAFAADAVEKDDSGKADVEKQISYALGYDISDKIKETFNLDADAFIEGLKDNTAGTAKFKEEKINELLGAYQKIAQQKQIANMMEQAKENKVKGTKFLEENKKKEGVVTLASGLQYKVLEKGEGPSPKATDQVECHYKGTLIDGTIFDSSYRRGKPATFQVGGVIPGWVEALQLMKVGSKWELYIPSALGYGDRGAAGAIGPGAALVFEVELLKIL